MPWLTQAMPITAPTMVCVVETGSASFVATSSHAPADASAMVMPSISSDGCCAKQSGFAIPFRIVLPTRPPSSTASAISNIAASTVACRMVSALAPTDVPKAMTKASVDATAASQVSDCGSANIESAAWGAFASAKAAQPHAVAASRTEPDGICQAAGVSPAGTSMLASLSPERPVSQSRHVLVHARDADERRNDQFKGSWTSKTMALEGQLTELHLVCLPQTMLVRALCALALALPAALSWEDPTATTSPFAALGCYLASSGDEQALRAALRQLPLLKASLLDEGVCEGSASMLLMAAREGRAGCVGALLSAGADRHLAAATGFRQGQTPLEATRSEAVRRLLRSPAQAAAEAAGAADLVDEQPPPRTAVQAKAHSARVTELGRQVRVAQTKALNRLHLACSRNDLPELRAALAAGADVNGAGPPPGKLSALIIAAQNTAENKDALKKVRTVEALLQAGANPSYQDAGGGHALLYASYDSVVPVVHALLKGGADPLQRAGGGQGPSAAEPGHAENKHVQQLLKLAVQAKKLGTRYGGSSTNPVFDGDKIEL